MKYALLAIALVSSPALAQTSASVTVGSDYVARGTSQTYNKPAITVYAEHQQNKFYAGGFAANVDFDDGTKLEADILAGYRTSIGKTNIDVGGIYITYHGKQTTNWNMVESHVSASRAFGPVNATAYVGYSPNYFNYAGNSVWSELSLSTRVNKRVTINGAVAYQYIQKDKSYATANVGADYALGKGFTASAKYYVTDWKRIGSPYLDGIYKSRVTFSVRKDF
jgi:uncharacterized protein (TIGR02001 family)